MADEARKVLSHLLSTVQDPKSRHYEKYAEWLQNSPGIEDFIFGCLRPQVIRWIENGKGSSIDSMKTIGGDISSPRRGVYLHGILGLDRYTLKYIGQTNDISIRIKKQHMYFRWRRDHASLHYFAVQNSSYDIFSILAEIPNPPAPSKSSSSTAPTTGGVLLTLASNYWDRTDLVLNILEMWTCLLFRSLPKASLVAYLPPGSPVPTGPPESLNVALPLDQGVEMSERDVVDLRTVKDPLLREWFRLDEGEVVAAAPVQPDTSATSAISERERRGYAVRGPEDYAADEQRKSQEGPREISPSVMVVVGFVAVTALVIFSGLRKPHLPRSRW